ncbi:MAG: hypothetical protein EOP50_09315 [Sphingobacteriales bacterium]|nr:MAG: hypothetical protein EOP50_09315 [Sphingobacteriales bacterium]
MKATVLAAFLLIVSIASFGKDVPGKKVKAVATVASYPGGDAAYNAFVNTVLSKAMRAGVAGQLPAGSYVVTLSFDVDAHGLVSNIRSVSANGFGIEEAAIAQFGTTGRWKPARSASGPVKSAQTQSFRFNVF